MESRIFAEMLGGYKDYDYPVNEGDTYESVYLFYNHATDYYKIGRSINPHRRMRNIETSSGCDLTLIGATELEPGYDPSARDVERFLHSFFDRKRMKGEWFSLDQRQTSLLRSFFRNVGEHYAGTWFE